MSRRITRAIIAACYGEGACPAGLAWARRKPRTVADLVARNLSWASWLALSVPELPDQMRDELETRIGRRTWWRDGVLHRGNGPARIDGDRRDWLRHGVPHRAGNRPAVLIGNRRREWWVDGQRHRTNGPAILSEVMGMEWWVEGRRHRDGGPAIVRPWGATEWWRHGMPVAPGGTKS